MYTLSKDYAIDYELIKNILDYAKEKSLRLGKLRDYYIGIHEIENREKIGDGLSNNKVMINHAKYIVDVNTSYLLGNPVDYQAAENINIEPVKDAYKQQTITDLDIELAKGSAICGVSYEYIYANEEAQPKSAMLDDLSVILVRDNTIEHNKLFAVMFQYIYNKNKTLDYTEIMIADKTKITTYKLKGSSLSKIKEQKHVFGDVPVIEYRNNAEKMGDFEPVISLINAYNLLQSDRINDKEQLVDAILCFYGMDFDANDASDLKAHRVIAKIPSDGKVEYLVKTLNETDTDILRKTIENDIHKISMTPNMGDENFVGNSSGVAIRYKLLPFEQNIKNKERYFEKGLMERFELYNNFLNTSSKMEKVPITEVDAVFKRNLPSNDFETSQMIANLNGVVDQETLIAQLSFVKDAKEIVELAIKEQEIRQTLPSYEELEDE